MSKTKNKVIDEQNATTVPAGSSAGNLLAILQADSNVTDKAAVVEGWFFNGTATPPVVYVQSDERVVAVAPTADAATELCGAVSSALANDYNTIAPACYGSEEMGEVWYIIETSKKN